MIAMMGVEAGISMLLPAVVINDFLSRILLHGIMNLFDRVCPLFAKGIVIATRALELPRQRRWYYLGRQRHNIRHKTRRRSLYGRS